MVSRSWKRTPSTSSADRPIQEQNVRFTFTIRPSGSVERYPIGAFS